MRWAPSPDPSCLGKKAYTSRKIAQIAMNRMWKHKEIRESDEMYGMHVYACPSCGWHIGHAIGIHASRKKHMAWLRSRNKRQKEDEWTDSQFYP